jgi:hypothetical protein
VCEMHTVGSKRDALCVSADRVQRYA